MTLTIEIPEREMIRRFALGEVDSAFFPGSPEQRDHVRALLRSEDPAEQDEGMRPFLAVREPLLSKIPRGTRWHLATLQLSEAEFRSILTMPVEGWTSLTRGTHRLCGV